MMMRVATACIYAAAFLVAAACACDEAQQFRLSDSDEARRISLTETSGGDKLRVCLDSAGGRPVDYYLTSQAAASQWMTAAATHYAISSQPYSQPPSTVYRSRLGTGGFLEEFEVSDAQAGDANKNFAVIVHATSACFGSGNSCVVDVAVHSISVFYWVWILLIVLGLVGFLCCMGACVYCCCCRKEPAAQPPQEVHVVHTHEQAPATKQV
jgi:hypothetical protein